MGMGGATTKSKNGKNKKNKTKKNGMQKSNPAASSSFDASASLMRLEKVWDEMQQASNKAIHSKEEDEDDTSGSMLASEMVVTVRAAPSPNKKSALSPATADWVPVAQLCLHPHSEVSSEWARAAVSLYCRELSFAATLGSKLFAKVPRQDLQYAIEPVDSFYKHVYDPIMEQKPSSSSSSDAGGALEGMTKAEARIVLDLVEDNSNSEEDQKSNIKRAYRKLSFQWHPDRLDKDLSESEVAHASHQYARVQKAYETLNSGIRSSTSSWYASLGGRERTDFRVIDSLLGQDEAASILERFRVKSAVVGLDPEVSQSFVTRNQASAKQFSK